MVDPRPLFAQGVATAFHKSKIRVLTLGPEALHDVPIAPDVALVSLECRDASGVVARLTELDRRVVVYGRVTPGALADVFRAGAVGFVPEQSDAAGLRDAVDAARLGQVRVPVDDGTLEGPPLDDGPFALLTPREREVLGGLMAGLRPAAIAQRDFVALVTVRNQVQGILTKLNVHSQLEAVALAHAQGWRAEAA